jgi:tetratricopeptide (TPR) repeat protein
LIAASRALAAGDDARALDLATQHLARYPSSRGARVLLARVHMHRGEFDAAYGQLRRALRDHPGDVDALYYMGIVSARLAELQFERLVKMAPQSARVHQLEAESLEAQERRDAAEKAYEAAVVANPSLIEPLLALAKLKRIRLACEEAIKLYETAERIRPTFDAAYGLGVCYQYDGRDQDAAVRFEQAIERDPRAAVAWAGLGTSLTKLGRPEDAILKLQRAIELEPAMGEAYYALAFAYRSAGQPDRAQEAFAKAREFGGATASGSGPAGSPPDR